MLGWRETHVEKIGEPSFERRFVTFSQRLNCKKRQRSTTISSTRFRRTQTPTTCGCDRRWSMSSRPIKISDRPVTLIRSPSTTSSLKESSAMYGWKCVKLESRFLMPPALHSTRAKRLPAGIKHHLLDGDSSRRRKGRNPSFDSFHCFASLTLLAALTAAGQSPAASASSLVIS